MTTIIIHGTAAAAEDWYWNSWHEGGFCQSLSNAMVDSSGASDVWTVNNIPVSEIAELNPKSSIWTGRMGQVSQRNGHFIWSGDFAATSRKMSGNDLAEYLNVLVGLTTEPLRLVAHSHGCNVVKLASASKKLKSNVKIDSAVFLACPHMTDANSGEVLYPLNRCKFGRIANFYSDKDPIVKTLAGAFATPSGYSYEVPDSTFEDPDPACRNLYENFNMAPPAGVKGAAVHSWLHGANMAYTAGLWLETGQF